jgi:poly(ADP-ribose) glycohydrolase ARH3
MKDKSSGRTGELLKSRFAGALLGTMVGDVLGAPFEGMPPEFVTDCWGNEQVLQRLQDSTYTDDTQMMMGVAESLAERGDFNGEHMAYRFMENYEPYRGYGSGAHRVLAALRQGQPWDQAATTVFPDGSFGNGAAMRVAPVGLFYHHDLAELRRVAELSASITHAHPLGKEGAALQACAVACAAACDPDSLVPTVFVKRLRAFISEDNEVYVRKLAAISELLQREPFIDDVVEQLGNDVRAQTAVPAAVYAFLARPNSFKEAVTFAVALGGDTDTIGAMTGAIAGAYHGLKGIPAEWAGALENTGKGRDYVMHLAAQLHARHAELLA